MAFKLPVLVKFPPLSSTCVCQSVGRGRAGADKSVKPFCGPNMFLQFFGVSMTNLSTRQLTMLQHFETWATNFLNIETRFIVVNHDYRATVNNHELSLNLEPRHLLFFGLHSVAYRQFST